MPWAAAAGVAAAGASIYGANKSSSAAKDAAGDPYAQNEYDMFLSNPTTVNPYSTTRIIKDGGAITEGEGAKADNTYKQVTRLTPEMEALNNRLLGMVGGSRANYTSGGMPGGMQDIYANTLANYGGGNAHMANALKSGVDIDKYRPAMPQYDRPQFGFGEGGGPVQAASLEDIVGEAGLSDMTNRGAYDWAIDNTDLSQSSIDKMSEIFAQSTNFGKRNTLLTGDRKENTVFADDSKNQAMQEFARVMAPYLDAGFEPQKNHATINAYPGLQALEAQEAARLNGDVTTQVQPEVDYYEPDGVPPQNYDQAAFARLLKSLGA